MSKSKIYDVCIIGAGYSGLVLATLCARASLLVCILERNNEVGKKILSTGNGRCNFTNSSMDSSCFFSSSGDLSTIDFDYRGSIEFIQSLGVLTTDVNGYYYPYTNQAKTIKNALENEIKANNIDLFLNSQAKKVEKNDIYTITTIDKNTINSKNVVIATGGLAAPKTGSNGDGHYFAKQLGISVVPCQPALVSVLSNDAKLKSLSGVRANGKVTFNQTSYEGELQFNKDSISGYPMMCLSRVISTSDNTDKKVYIDFLPNYTTKDILKLLEKKDNFTVENAINGIINDKITGILLNEFKLDLQVKIADLSSDKIIEIAELIKNMPFSFTQTKDFDFAQTTAGGIMLSELDLSTMMVKKKDLNNLYFIGEVVDVDGICGGYNLEWARTSASIAARSIITNSRG